MTTPLVSREGRVPKPALFQDISKKINVNRRCIEGLGFTETQIDLAGRIVALLVMRRTLSREDARRMTPRGLAAIASLIPPDEDRIEALLASGIVRKSQALINPSLVPAPTQTRAALAKATILVHSHTTAPTQ